MLGRNEDERTFSSILHSPRCAFSPLLFASASENKSYT